MKAQVLSDLHLEHYKDPRGFINSLPATAPNLILAGDILSLAPHKYQWAVARIKDFTARWERVYYIPGNHEFYGTSMSLGYDTLRKIKVPGFKRLDTHKARRLGDSRVWGSTMWFPDVGRIDRPINDFRYIGGFDFGGMNEAFRIVLDRVRPDVVVTHHLPSFKSVNGRYVEDSANWCYVSNMESYILKHKPRVWIHGHTHDPIDYVLGQTRIVCNPSGYPRQTHPDFRPDLVVEL